MEYNPYSLVIMDLTIPGKMRGKETIALLKELDPSAKAIVASGYSNDPIMTDYMEYGFPKFSQKRLTRKFFSK